MVQYCSTVRKLLDLKAADFFPKPKIDSTGLEIRFRRPQPAAAHEEAFFFNLVGAAFGQRRKMLRNALTSGRLPVDADRVIEGLHAAGIAGDRRAETLSVAEFVRLSNTITDRVKERGGAVER